MCRYFIGLCFLCAITLALSADIVWPLVLLLGTTTVTLFVRAIGASRSNHGTTAETQAFASYEACVGAALLHLDRRKFRVYNDIIIPDGEGGTTQIDHVVVCSGGLYLIESKGWGETWANRQCFVCGSESAPQWKLCYETQQGWATSEHFVPNPLWQNYKHHLCLAQMLNIPRERIHPILALSPYCRMMRHAAIPNLCLSPDDVMQTIQTQAGGVVFSPTQLKDILLRLDIYKMASTPEATHAHVERLKEKFSGDTCPRCGKQLVERRSQKGDGAPFLGCTGYPRCRYTRPLTPKA